jgi:hypothetical protein
MRFMLPLFVAIAACCFAPGVFAQEKEKFREPEIKKIHVGFQTFQDDERTVYKAGLWTPIYIHVNGGTEGIQPKPNKRPPYLEIETEDSEGVGTQIEIQVGAVPAKETHMFIGYLKTGHLGRNMSEIKVNLHANGQKYEPRSIEPMFSLNINAHLYLTLGSKMDDLNKAVKRMDQQQQGDEKGGVMGLVSDGLRNVVFETNADRLPDAWFGYNGVDMIFLTTEKKKFLDELNLRPEKIKALSQWVRRGGRLVIPVAPANQDKIAAVLDNKSWQPPIPVLPTRIAENASFQRLTGLEEWGNVRGEPYQRFNPKNPQERLPLPIATFDTANASGNWEVLATNTDDPNARPLVARVRYGLGQIVYIAVSLEDTAFFAWDKGKHKFLEGMLNKLAPTSPAHLNERDFMGRGVSNDLSTDLIAQLDNFDVKVIPFGYVALFIVLYILVVGPLDFFLLKYVFKRLEWTWITFPAVVLAVSVIAYFAAYALKGRDLKINKVDVVDFDLRTSLDKNGQPKVAYAYGHTFFTILSPRIQNYTVGVEPNPLFWGEEIKKVPHVNNKGNDEIRDEVFSADLLSWMGRPSGGMHDMGRSGSSSFFRKPYRFLDDASAVEGVPIPVWTTKAFSASFEQKLPKAPFKADLSYHHEKDVKITGKIENHLGVDLVDTWLLYDGRVYPIEGGLKSVAKGGPAKELAIPANANQEIKSWTTQGMANPVDGELRVWTSNPASLMKQMLFIGKVDVNNTVRNHLLRPLDLGWRVDKIQDVNVGRRDRQTREAVVFARTRFASGSAESLTADTNNPVATKIWLQGIPRTGSDRPELVGTMNQDTYIRVIVPIRAADE